MSGHLESFAQAPQQLEGFRQSPAPNTGVDWSAISRTLTDQITSHKADIGNSQDAKNTDDMITHGIRPSQLRDAIKSDLKGDLDALHGGDATQARRDQNVINFADHLLAGYDQNGNHVSLDSQQTKDLQNLIAAEKKDQINSINDIPNEQRYAQQDTTLLQHLDQGTATPEEISNFISNRREDSANEAGYIRDDQTAVKALQKVMKDFAPAGG